MVYIGAMSLSGMKHCGLYKYGELVGYGTMLLI